MQEDARMGSVTRAARSVGGDAGSSVTVGPQGPPHMAARRDEGRAHVTAPQGCRRS